jgi:hypothetical protein
LVGHRMVEGKTVPTDGARARLEAAAGVLNELGGLAELEEQDGTLVIRGYGCPLAAVTPDHPEVCRLAEALVAEVAGVSVVRGRAAASRWRRPMTLPKDSCACRRQIDLDVKSAHLAMRLVQSRRRRLEGIDLAG